MSAKTAAPAANPDSEAQAAVAGAGETWSALVVERRRGDPRLLRRQEINARFMTAQQMQQLVANLRRDGILTSLPLCYEAPGSGVAEILSGHHRVEAAILAGFAEIDYLCIVSPLTEARKRAIQLSHNAISGQDDPATLAAMYADLDLDAKTYSGLDDTVLTAMDDIELTGLNVGVKYQEMHLYFLPEDAGVVRDVIEAIDKAARKNQAYVAAYADFDAFFETVVAAKAKFQAFNSAIAMRVICDLAAQKLAEMTAAATDTSIEAEAANG